MNTGVPGTGLATIFYVLSVLVMPVVELARSRRSGSWSARRWRQIARHFVVAGTMAFMLYGTIAYLLLPVETPAPLLGRGAALALTLSLLLGLVALTIPRPRRSFSLPVPAPVVIDLRVQVAGGGPGGLDRVFSRPAVIDPISSSAALV